jgi:hypothetical protein
MEPALGSGEVSLTSTEDGSISLTMAHQMDWPVGRIEWEVTIDGGARLPALELQARATELAAAALTTFAETLTLEFNRRRGPFDLIKGKSVEIVWQEREGLVTFAGETIASEVRNPTRQGAKALLGRGFAPTDHVIVRRSSDARDIFRGTISQAASDSP